MNKKLREIALEVGLLNYIHHETPRHYFISDNADEYEIQEFSFELLTMFLDTLELKMYNAKIDMSNNPAWYKITNELLNEYIKND